MKSHFFPYDIQQKKIPCKCVRAFHYIRIFNSSNDEWQQEWKSQVLSSLKFPFGNISTINYAAGVKTFFFTVQTFRIHSSITFISCFSPQNQSDDFRFPGDDVELQLQFVISSRNRFESGEVLLSPALLIFSLLVTRAIKTEEGRRQIESKDTKQHRISRNAITMRDSYLWTKRMPKLFYSHLFRLHCSRNAQRKRIYELNVISWFAFSCQTSRRDVKSSKLVRKQLLGNWGLIDSEKFRKAFEKFSRKAQTTLSLTWFCKIYSRTSNKQLKKFNSESFSNFCLTF